MNICIRQENFAILFLFIFFWLFVLNEREIIPIKMSKEKMSNVSIFDNSTL